MLFALPATHNPGEGRPARPGFVRDIEANDKGPGIASGCWIYSASANRCMPAAGSDGFGLEPDILADCKGAGGVGRAPSQRLFAQMGRV